MRTFMLATTGWKYKPEKQAKLEALGFQFVTDEYGSHKDLTAPRPTLTIETLDDLMAFVSTWDTVILEEDGTLEIYDDYRE